MKNYDVIDLFRSLAGSASYHYADDTGKEWGDAARDEYDARNLYKNHPELKEDFDMIMRNQLWSM